MSASYGHFRPGHPSAQPNRTVAGAPKCRGDRRSPDRAARSVTSKNFLTEVVVSRLNWDYGAHITSIDNDHRSAVTVEKYDRSLRLRVECDFVEHGVAAIWQA